MSLLDTSRGYVETATHKTVTLQHFFFPPTGQYSSLAYFILNPDLVCIDNG